MMKLDNRHASVPLDNRPHPHRIDLSKRNNNSAGTLVISCLFGLVELRARRSRIEAPDLRGNLFTIASKPCVIASGSAAKQSFEDRLSSDRAPYECSLEN